jgi:hypothetical protein
VLNKGTFVARPRSQSAPGSIREYAATSERGRDSMTFTRITVRPDQMGGVPCIRGLQIPVATIVDMVADEMAKEEILAAYPT